ncbi:InlB B-repeat-containing protein [Burkholderia ambifaria]|uniref:Bacterial repeat domain-containing protein n=1 Tax=Burkholderia ambifaria MEX-5 TaxID=396597 RepID=B1T4P8_9BURK|nr:hypothetical protein [Burkholderia ambifaria]EDT41447.1 hypothetical protein BamMEX5DRAFT_2764 [Burkholderia ambifaria MEX-5]
MTGKPIFARLAGDHDHSPSSRTLGERTAGLDATALREALVLAHQAHTSVSQLMFNLFDDLVLTLQTELIEPFGTDGIAWRGQLTGVRNVRGYLAVSGLRSNNGALMASGSIMVGTERYSITPAGNNTVHIARSDNISLHCHTSLFPEETGSSPNSMDSELADDAAADVDGADSDFAVIPILALYSTRTKNGIKGGVAAIDAIMASAQLYTNDAFHTSGVPARIEVKTQELAALPHQDTSSLIDIVRKPGTELWNLISAAREKHQTSVVVLLTDLVKMDKGFSYSEGVASKVPEPPRLSQTDLDYSTLAMTLSGVDSAAVVLAHELGHLLGSKHDRLTMPRQSFAAIWSHLKPEYDYVRGYIPEDRSFVTLMGYNRDGIPRVPAYSAADKNWNGQPLGIPMGQPDAADDARFFRISTRVVANYRVARYGSENTPHWVPVNMELSVSPAEGGAVLPGSLGPYPENSSVKVIALPRAGYQFSHWSLDGKDAGRDSSTVVSMQGKDRTLVAHFVVGDERHTLNIEQPPADTHLVIKVSPEGPAYLPDTEVTLSLTGPSAAEMIDRWMVDGQPAGNAESIIVIPRKNHSIKAQIRASRHFIKFLEGQNPLNEVGTTSTYSVGTFNQDGSPAPGQWVTFFSLTNHPDTIQVESPVRVQTDAHGHASIKIKAGVTPTIFNLMASLENSDARPATIRIAILHRALFPVSPKILHVFPNDPTTVPFEVQVRDLGNPAAQGITVDFRIGESSANRALMNPEITPTGETDEHGIAKGTLTLAKIAEHWGWVTIIGQVSDKNSVVYPPTSTVELGIVFVTRRSIFALGKNVQTIRVGDSPEPMEFVVVDYDVGDGQHRPEKDTPVKLTININAGTTGIPLESDIVRTSQGTANVSVGIPIATGLVTIAAHADHVPPEEHAFHTIRVVSGTGSVRAVSDKTQLIQTGKTPAPLVVEVLENGKPAAPGTHVYIDIDHKSGQTGLQSSVKQTQTDQQGRAQIAFSSPAVAAGNTDISVCTDTALPEIFHINVVAPT